MIEGRPISDVLGIAERLRAGMAALRFETVAGILTISCSFGVSEWQPAFDIGHLLKLADRKYAARARFGYCRGSEPVDYVRHIDERFTGYAQLVPLKK